MPNEHEDVEQIWEQISESISSLGFQVFPSSISGTDGVAIWPVSEGFAKFLDLATSLGKKILYVHTIDFSSEELIDLVMNFLPTDIGEYDVETVEGFFASLGVSSDSQVTEYIEYGRRFAGRLASIRLEWVHEGVVHRYWRMADWYGFLLEKGGEISDLIEHQSF